MGFDRRSQDKKGKSSHNRHRDRSRSRSRRRSRSRSRERYSKSRQIKRGGWDQKESRDDFSRLQSSNSNNYMEKIQQQQGKSYKTAMCPHIQGGNCFKGERCTFAHTKNELNQYKQSKFSTATQMNHQNQKEQKQIANTILQQQTLANANYKTMLCKNFTNGNCRYGDKCTFSHGQQDLRQRSTQQAIAMAAQYDMPEDIPDDVPSNSYASILNQFMNPYVLAALDFNAAPTLDQENFTQSSQLILDNISTQVQQQKELQIQQMIIQKQLEQQAKEQADQQ